MFEWFKQHRLGWLVAGGIAGALVASLWTRDPLHAVSTDRQESLIIATGQLEEGIEAIYVLDSLTGDLRGSAISPRSGKFTAMFQTNVVKDMQIDIAKNPRFLMVTGTGSLQRQAGAGNTAPGEAVVYVAELTTGRIGAYAAPIQPGSLSTGRATGGNFIPLDIWPFRQAVVR